MTLRGGQTPMDQIKLHEKIELILKNGPDLADVININKIISSNFDARNFFFTLADDRWLEWLWKNGLLDAIKKKSDDPTHYSYSTPELSYLEKVAVKKPDKVIGIILAVPISKAAFNPEVIDRFLRIGKTLPPEQLSRLVRKIHDDHWIPLMGVFNRWGFEYEKMLSVLADAKDDDSILILAEALLETRPETEIEQKPNGLTDDEPFYFEELEHTKVFEYLLRVADTHKDRALEITLNALQRVLLTGGTKDDDDTFTVPETIQLFDVNFFSLKVGQKADVSYREDAYSLATVVKQLTLDIFGRESTPERIKEVYDKYFANLPDAPSLWRFKLFIICQYPAILTKELRAALIRLFETEAYHDILSGEYFEMLRLGFNSLNDEGKREYVSKVFDYFGRKASDNETQKWHKEYGWRILSSIQEGLTDEEKESCEKDFGKKWDPSLKPIEKDSSSRFGVVKPRGPITLEEFGKLPIKEIADKLQKEWTPKRLRDRNDPSNIHNPLNAEGAGELLSSDLEKRLQDYLDSASLFFERGVLDQHYTYAFIRGIEQKLREGLPNAKETDWNGFIKLCLIIKDSGEKQEFKKEIRDRDILGGWLAGWTGVHSAIADVLLKLLEEPRGGDAILDFEKYRDDVFSIITYLLKYRDPIPEDEQPKTAKIKIQLPDTKENLSGDAFTTAINSVRGRAFQVFVNFVYHDSKLLDPEKRLKIADDVKEVYETVLSKENTQAVMFLFGRNLSQFYFRDKKWLISLLPKIFPTDPEKVPLYLSAWEGYLSMNLFEEMFTDEHFQELYQRAINVSPSEYPKRRYSQELDEGLGIHLALAFVHYDFGFDSPLFQSFWENTNEDRHGGFISLIGRHVFSGEDSQMETLLRKKLKTIKKIEDFWDRAIDHCDEVEALKEFGYWMSTEKKILDLSWQAERIRKTLQKTDGVVGWDYALSKSISDFAKANPTETLEILKLHLLKAGVQLKRAHIPFSFDSEWLEAFKILYDDPKTKNGVYDLINDLIREGGSTFWILKNIIDPPKQ